MRYQARLRGAIYVSKPKDMRAVTVGQPLLLIREPHNPHHSNALLATDLFGKKLAYIERTVADKVSPRIDRGEMWLCKVIVRPQMSRGRLPGSIVISAPCVVVLWRGDLRVKSKKALDDVPSHFDHA